MGLKPYKFIVQAVCHQVEVTKSGDAVGDEPYTMAAIPGQERIVGEVEVQPVVLYGCDALAEWAKDFAAKLAEAEARQIEEKS